MSPYAYLPILHLSVADRKVFLSAAGLQGAVLPSRTLAEQLRSFATTHSASEVEAILADAGVARAAPLTPPPLELQLRAVAQRAERVAILAHGCAAPSELLDALDGAVARADAAADDLSPFDMSFISLCRELRNAVRSDAAAEVNRSIARGGEPDAESGVMCGRVGALVTSEHMLQRGNPLGGALCAIATELDLGPDEWRIVRRECEVASNTLGVAWNIAPARRFPPAAATRAKHKSAFATMIKTQRDSDSGTRTATEAGHVTDDARLSLASAATVSGTTAAALIAEPTTAAAQLPAHTLVATGGTAAARKADADDTSAHAPVAAAALEPTPQNAADDTPKRIWKVKMDTKSGRPYFINKVTKETTWLNPGSEVLVVKSPKIRASASPPPSPSLSTLVACAASSPRATPSAAAAAPSPIQPPAATVTTAPSPGALPPRIWKSKVDKASGRTYFINKVTKETTWTHPGDEQLALPSPKQKQKQKQKQKRTAKEGGLNATQMAALRSDAEGYAADSTRNAKTMNSLKNKRGGATAGATPFKLPTTTPKRAPGSSGKKKAKKKKKTLKRKTAKKKKTMGKKKKKKTTTTST